MDSQNKQILMDAINELIHNSNLNFDPGRSNEVFSIMETQCNYYNNNKANYNSLSDINKLIIKDCFDYMRKHEGKKKIMPGREQNAPPGWSGIKEKNTDFDKMLNAAKNDFDKSINGNRPAEIDFSASAGEFPSDNVEKTLKKTLEDREKDLLKITNHYQNKRDAEKWIKPEGENIAMSVSESEPEKLIINETVELNDIELTEKKERKKVTFNDFIDNSNKIQLPPISNKNSDNTDIIEKINVLLKRQEKIMNHLGMSINR